MMNPRNERGIAMILALVLMAALSILASSLMFLSQTETYASMNYRMMSQTRYAAESAVHKATNFLVGGAYTVPSNGGVDLLSYYDRTVSPVKCAAGAPNCTAGQPIVLSASGSNYPVPAVVTAFKNAANGTMTVGGTTITESATATLLSMQTFESYGGGQAVVQTWEITGAGTMTGSRAAKVEVVAVVETPKVPAASYAAFATADTCGAIYFHGNVTVDSYDSTGLTAAPTMTYGGNVGTNGNLQVQGSVDVKGTLSTPRTGVGSCNAGNVTALTETGSARVKACATCQEASAENGRNDSMITLPKAVTWPTPQFSAVPPADVTVTINAALLANPVTACQSLGTVPNGAGLQVPLTSGSNCIVNAASKTITIDSTAGTGLNPVDVTMPNVVLAGGYTLVIKGQGPQNVNINSLTGSGTIAIDANMTSSVTNQSVVLKVAGKNPAGVTSTLPDPTDMAVAIDLEATGWKQNASNGHQYDASAFQIVYGGTGTLSMDGGNSQTAATIYAPNAKFYLKGTQDLYGSILAKTIENAGNASIHYDRRLMKEFFVAGQPMAGTFTWKRSS